MAPSRTHLTPADRHQMEVEAAIAQHGFHATHVLGDEFEPAFSYTTGFLLAGHPELLVLGLAPVHCRFFFDHLMAEVRRGVTHPVGREHALMVNDIPYRLLPVPVEHWGGGDCLMLGFASYYGPRQFPVDEHSVVQVIWPDRKLRFPWDDDAMSTLVRDQPVLAEGDPPRRRWPVDHPVDDGSTCSTCCSEPRNRAERRRQGRGRG